MAFSGVFAVGLSGVTAYAASLEAVSSNIANSQTDGYKRVRTEFSTLIGRDAPDSQSAVSAGGVGSGVNASNRLLLAEQGGISRTNEATNLAVFGNGFFVVAETPDGESGDTPFLFTRAGGFAADEAGNLKNDAGYYLQGTVANGGAPSASTLAGLETVNLNRIPEGDDAAALGARIGVKIEKDGGVVASYANGATRTLFYVPLALFVNAEGLEAGAGTAFRATGEAGALTLATASEGRAGSIEGSAKEISTVDIGQEFSALIETQRAYSTNARILSAADELWRTVIQTAA